LLRKSIIHDKRKTGKCDGVADLSLSRRNRTEEAGAVDREAKESARRGRKLKSLVETRAQLYTA